MTEQAHSWFNSLGSSDLVHHRNLSPSCWIYPEKNPNIFNWKGKINFARADESTRKSRQWGFFQKANCCTQVHCSCLFPPTENSRTERTTEKDRSGGRNHLDKFDKLRRLKLSKRWEKVKVQERANNLVSLSNRNTIFSHIIKVNQDFT